MQFGITARYFHGRRNEGRILIRYWIAGGAALILVLALWILSYSTPVTDVRYRMIVTVMDGDRPIVGASVRRFRTYPSGMGGLHSGSSSDGGDSVIIPVRGKLLVATHAGWGGDGSSCVGRRSIHGGTCGLRWTWSPMGALDRHPTLDAVNLAMSEYPVLVTFDGPPSLRNIVVVDPDHLEREFGAGVRIHRISVGRSNAPLSHNQASQLPFVKTLTGSLTCSPGDTPLGGTWSSENQTANRDLGQCIYKGFF